MYVTGVHKIFVNTLVTTEEISGCITHRED